MALIEEYTNLTVATFMSTLATFAASNGWTVTTNNSTVVTMNKGGRELSFYNNSSTPIFTVRVSGVTSPNIPFNTFSYTATTVKYRFVSCGNDLYFAREWYYSGGSNYQGWFWGGVGTLSTKIGAWSGGTCALGSFVSSGMSPVRNCFFSNNPMCLDSSVFYEGSWTPLGAAAGGRPHGTIGTDVVTSAPNYYNAAILPVPVLVSLYDTNTTYLRPIGFADTVFRAATGNVYADMEIIAISGQQYAFSSYNSYLFKVS